MRRRRLVAALLFCAAGALTVQQLTPADPPTTAVLVAARDLPAGAALTAADVTGARVVPAMVPDGAFSPDAGPAAIDGEQLSGPVRRGEVLTDASLLSGGLLTGAPPGSQAVPLRLADPATIQLLGQGQLVDVVLSSSPGGDAPPASEVLAAAVPVLWTPAADARPAGLLPGKDTEGLVVVAAGPAQAASLAGASARGKLFLVLVGP